MKLFLIITLICVIMLIAKSLSTQYRDKYEFYYNLNQFLTNFKINLGFKQSKILDFIKDIKPRKDFKIFIESYQTYLKTSTLDLTSIKNIDNEERKELEDIIKNIGKLNIEGELSQINSFLSCVEARLKYAEDNKNKICPMILKLSFLFAVGLAILFI